MKVYVDKPSAINDPNGYLLQGTTLVADLFIIEENSREVRAELLHVGDLAAFLQRRGEGLRLVN